MIVAAQCLLKTTKNCLLVMKSRCRVGITTCLEGERNPGIGLGNNEGNQCHVANENKNVFDQKAKGSRLNSGN